MSGAVGKSIKRVEDPRFIQGKGKYVANLKIPGMAYAAIARSPHAHAKINGIDASAALAMPGVIAVFTGADLAADNVGGLPCGFNPPDIKTAPHPALAIGKVRHVGDGVAVVIADDRYTAQDAVDAIVVDYAPLPAVIDAKKAAEPGAPLVHDEIPNNVSFHWPLGTREAINKVLAEADRVVELDLINQRLIPNAME
ncbi:MAG: xanthine dehydrogenase family protein molybdopterin-binding subunit, partial [Caldilineaceae bacterium]|nr:xanthine dehydrogenase family protein molybdopterin-binding subunit [Caldilineaceae bacterium]